MKTIRDGPLFFHRGGPFLGLADNFFLKNILKDVTGFFIDLMTFKTIIIGHLLKVKVCGWVIHCCHGNQLMGERLAKNMIKEANFSKHFSDSSQMMLKLGRNIRWAEIL